MNMTGTALTILILVLNDVREAQRVPFSSYNFSLLDTSYSITI